MNERDQRVWGAVIVPVGVRDVFGGLWDLDQLYLTSAGAALGLEAHARKMNLLPVAWAQADDKLLIGRTHAANHPEQAYVLLVRSLRLPDEMTEMTLRRGR